MVPRYTVLQGGGQSTAPTDAMLEAPAHLNADGRTCWFARLGELTPGGVFALGQRSLFVRLCELFQVVVALARRLDRLSRRHKRVGPLRTRPVYDKLQSRQSGLYDQMAVLYDRLGIPPRATRVNKS